MRYLKKYGSESAVIKDKRKFNQLFQLNDMHSIFQLGYNMGCTAANINNPPPK
jgi:hypothetical protein